MKLGISRQIFEKYSDMKFCENPPSGSRVVPCEQTDMTKLIVAFLNFAKAPPFPKKRKTDALFQTKVVEKSKHTFYVQ
jgi:hypothetical protein